MLRPILSSAQEHGKLGWVRASTPQAKQPAKVGDSQKDLRSQQSRLEMKAYIVLYAITGARF
jgi:hypothetical protein